MPFFRAWRRKRLLARHHIEDTLWRDTLAGLPFLAWLDDAERERLRTLVSLFLGTKEMHGAAGLVLDDDIRVAIATQACVPILNLGIDYYDGWIGVIVYPGDFRVPREEIDEAGVVHHWTDALSGEAWPGGPVVLSWENVRRTAHGYNVVIHEFAHKLDMRHKRDADGCPAPRPGMDAALWYATLEQSYAHFHAAVERGAARHPHHDAPPPVDEWGRILPFDPYAAEHPAEFYAVMTEAFFTDAPTLQLCYPELYAQFARYYALDPAARLATPQQAATDHA